MMDVVGYPFQGAPLLGELPVKDVGTWASIAASYTLT